MFDIFSLKDVKKRRKSAFFCHFDLRYEPTTKCPRCDTHVGIYLLMTSKHSRTLTKIVGADWEKKSKNIKDSLKTAFFGYFWLFFPLLSTKTNFYNIFDTMCVCAARKSIIYLSVDEKET